MKSIMKYIKNSPCAGQLLSLLCLTAVTQGLQADVNVWNFDRATTNVASGVVTFEDSVVEPGNALSFEKDGDGTLIFDLNAANQREEMRLNVTKGNIVLTDTRPKPTATSTPPAFIAEKAALWLKPDVNVAASGSGGVADWCDCREEAAAPERYWHAAAAQLAGASDIVYPTTRTIDGNTYLNFGGIGSYCTLRFNKPGSTTASDMSGVYHIFAVTRIETSVGHIFGTQSARPPFNSGSKILSNVASVDSVTYFDADYSAPVGLQGQYRLNGMDQDLTATPIQTNRTLLIEWEAGVTRTDGGQNGLPKVGAIYLERTNTYRAGGDDVGEYIVFTNRLTAAERIAVEDYLMANWIESRKEAAGYTLKLAGDSEAHLDVAASELADGRPFGFSGGTLVKKGASALRVRPRVDHKFGGAVRVDEGSLIAETRSLSYDFRSGEGVCAVTDRYDVATFAPEAGVPSGVARATGGGGAYVVSRLDADIGRLEVDGRQLVLAAPSMTAALPSVSEIEATFDDPSFEKSGYYTVTSPNVATYNGWTFAPLTRSGNGDSNFYVEQPTLSNWTMGFDYVPPRGSKVLNMRGFGAFWTTVNVPAPGRYELTFKTCPRAGYSGGEVVVSLFKGATTNVVAKLHPYSTNGFRMQRVMLPEIAEAGEYGLRFEQTHDAEHFCAYSDFKVSRITDAEALSAFQVPNGDFEDTTFSVWTFTVVYDLSHVNGIAGWTLTQTASATTRPAASPIACSMNGRFRAPSSPSGNVQLMLVSNGAAAETTDCFVLPAGRWRLSYLACRWGMRDSDTVFKWNDKYVGLAPVIETVVTINGQETSLGSTEAISGVVFARQYSDIVEIPEGGAQVKVKLVQIAEDDQYYAGALIDDVCFVRADEQTELVRDGSFEAGGAWRVVTFRNDSDDYLKNSAVYSMFPGSGSSQDVNYGTATCDGRKCYILVQTGALLQDIDFKEAGVHRISFWARARVPSSLSDTYAGNQVRAALIRGSVTNEITRTETIYSTNFCQHARLFNVPSAGTWTLMIQGVNGLPLPDGSHVLTSRRGVDGKDQNVLVDAISVRKAEVKPAPDIPKSTVLFLSGNTKLDLDFPGVAEIDDVYFNGRRAQKTVNAANYPDYVTGIGTIEPKKVGFILSFR